MNHLVLVVSEAGIPGQLFGPYEQYSEAEEVLKAALVKGDNQNGPVKLTEEVIYDISADGYYSFEGGGGIYIVLAEPYAEAEEVEVIVETDFLIVTHGSVWTFQPLTEVAKNFTEMNLQVEGWQWIGPAFGVDARLASALVSALEDEKFNLEIK
jgi:hypothetical protein